VTVRSGAPGWLIGTVHAALDVVGWAVTEAPLAHR
jgi:hypothetical protein